MPVEPVVGLSDQPPVEARLTNTGFVTSYEQDGPSVGIEGKGNSPGSVVGSETQLLHVGVTRAVQRIYAWTAQKRSEGLQNLRTRKELVLNTDSKPFELRVEGRIERYDPTHAAIMPCISYAVKFIYQKLFGLSPTRKRTLGASQHRPPETGNVVPPWMASRS